RDTRSRGRRPPPAARGRATPTRGRSRPSRRKPRSRYRRTVPPGSVPEGQSLAERGSGRRGAMARQQPLRRAPGPGFVTPLLMPFLTGVGVWLVVRDLRVHPDLRKGVFGVMFSKATLYALCFGVVVGGLTTGLVHPRSLLLGPADAMPWSTRLMLSLGAGLYEELLFRVLLVGALAWAARRFLGWAARPAGVTA